MLSWRLLPLLLALGVVGVCGRAEERPVYVNEWAVEIGGGERVAREVAAEHGFDFDGQIGAIPDTFAFLRKTMASRSRRAAESVNDLLAKDDRVSWYEQQQKIVHMKKGADVVPPDETGDNRPIPFNDPLWSKQWYLYNNGQKGATPGMDMNLMPAWKLGYTGKGVVVTIVDDGVDQYHPDLKDNFDKYASYDFNNKSRKNNPYPDYSRPAQVRHGTRCAGEVAAAANNSICGVGVAYEAGIGGIRLLDGDTTDRLTAEALHFNSSHIDIYSCCWGPADDGKHFAMPHYLTRKAFSEGAKQGRNGKGSIFVWASGNGGNKQDHCGADGYVGNIHTIAISSINDHGRLSYFVESCPAIMAVTLSGGPQSTMEIRDGRFHWNLVTTTDLYGNCTTGFVGTSSAAPLASGMFAIILQANPQLTWRDLQYIITEGSRIPQPYDSGWRINGAGLHVHHQFGFGMLDAGSLVELALTWELVGPQLVCEVNPDWPDSSLSQGSHHNFTLDVACPNVYSMEHTVATVSFRSPRRGDISLTLFSPFGTPSELLAPRRLDSSDEGVVEWPFMSVHNWGEDPNGQWTLQFSYNPTPPGAALPEDETLDLDPRFQESVAVLTSWGLTIYGVQESRRSGEEEVKEEDKTDEDTPAIYPDDAGKSDQNTIKKIYNNEQKEPEEINLQPDDIGEGVPMPPNLKHNINAASGAIDTTKFDGYLRTRYGITFLTGFAKRLLEGDPIATYLASLDERSLEMLGRELPLDDLFERMAEEQDEEQKRDEQINQGLRWGREWDPDEELNFEKKADEEMDLLEELERGNEEMGGRNYGGFDGLLKDHERNIERSGEDLYHPANLGMAKKSSDSRDSSRQRGGYLWDDGGSSEEKKDWEGNTKARDFKANFQAKNAAYNDVEKKESNRNEEETEQERLYDLLAALQELLEES
ncbi:neuroendocrine convertase 2-like [Diadema antillarum]|uniref:neuroendocrine convertase 2-like n=1 Tax=Diadema antillarum TaxID=105358 RepID=UPI003A84A4E6